MESRLLFSFPGSDGGNVERENLQTKTTSECGRFYRLWCDQCGRKRL